VFGVCICVMHGNAYISYMCGHAYNGRAGPCATAETAEGRMVELGSCCGVHTGSAYHIIRVANWRSFLLAKEKLTLGLEG